MSGDFDINENNPFGLHFLKFAICLGLISIHAVVWVAQAAGFVFRPGSGWGDQLISLAATSLLVPITAGAVQAISLKDQFVGGRLAAIPLAPFFRVFLLLAFLESAKAALLYGPGVFFGWNVLHMIAVSLMVILCLARISVRLVAVSAALCVLLTYPLRLFFQEKQVTTAETARWLQEMGAGPYLIGFLFCLLMAAVLFWLYRTPRLERRYKFRMALLLTMLFDLALLSLWMVDYQEFTAARIINLPAGALVGDTLGLHYWPLFPWYATVACGFLFYYWLPRTKYPREARIILWLAAGALLAIYVPFFSHAIVREVSPQSLWSSELFAGSLGLLLMVAGVFLFKAALYDKLSRSRRVNAAIGRHPLLFRIPFVFSKTIFWCYLFLNTIAVYGAIPFARLLPTPLALTIYPLFLIFTWYWLGEFVLRYLGRLKFQVGISSARSGASR